ncbi:hypothetical protein ANAPC1_00410 [Anaplasma phagocytophilum]|uniref:Uncharacterized protein n=1 Tax=Anaplasma phagocytophilum TaxID=948 RepID=A0AA45ZHA7_ANAPH|nr:hypothetical protein [Anaplasma phagocytophilum]SBO14066.1 hypothetical protein ANAPC1_00410 [Anaplasma phagocytophilum]SBO31148.1 hypothetical protein ANAPC4_00406 [Anaplasma phagocytophilum]
MLLDLKHPAFKRDLSKVCDRHLNAVCVPRYYMQKNNAVFSRCSILYAKYNITYDM